MLNSNERERPTAKEALANSWFNETQRRRSLPNLEGARLSTGSLGSFLSTCCFCPHVLMFDIVHWQNNPKNTRCERYQQGEIWFRFMSCCLTFLIHFIRFNICSRCFICFMPCSTKVIGLLPVVLPPWSSDVIREGRLWGLEP